MRTRPLTLLCAALALLTLPPPAQNQTLSQSIGATLNHGALTVWIVHPTPDMTMKHVREYATAVQLPTTVQQQTAGSFGTPSSNVGQTAGSYGQSPSALGTASSNVGATAGSYGKSPSTLGRNASDVGQTAGSYGQTAGSFGDSLSTLADAGTRPAQNADSQFHHPPHNAEWSSFLNRLHGDYPELKVTVVDVREDEIDTGLDAARGTPDYPDVLLGEPLPGYWTQAQKGQQLSLEQQLAFTNLGTFRTGGYAIYIANGKAGAQFFRPGAGVVWIPSTDILLAAPHPHEAQAFVAWTRIPDLCCSVPRGDFIEDAAKAARAAVAGYLAEGNVGSIADPEMAEYNGPLARLVAFRSDLAPSDLSVQTEVYGGSSNSRLAALAVRAVAAGPSSIGIFHSLVILRRNDNGQWRVLCLIPNYAPGTESNPIEQLADYTTPLAPDAKPAAVAGVELASPPDNDNRNINPALWWDNKGGAGLQIIEYQRNTDRGWLSPELMYVPDTNNRLRTQITAPFSTFGQYRWRVWSVGKGGTLVLSPWRKVNITSR